MQFVCGIDECGRGSLAGPVTAACASYVYTCGMPEGLADSKKLSAKKRDNLARILKNSPTVFFALGWVSPHTIDRINIHQASLLAMRLAYTHMLCFIPSACTIAEVLVDGLHFPAIQTRGRAIVKGDETEPCIQAASILAKTARDSLMSRYIKQFPQYSFDQHKGYPTHKHLHQIMEHGISPIHRRRFCYKYIS